jgi:hypothetical protein
MKTVKKKHVAILHSIHASLTSPASSLGKPDDQGCVACGTIYTADWYTQHGAVVTVIVDARGRYWCISCATEALARLPHHVDVTTRSA